MTRLTYNRLRVPTTRLFEPVDISSLVFFRVAFGSILVWEVVRYFSHGWISRYYIEPSFYFTYLGFDWVRPWPGAGMVVHFSVLGVLAGFIALGFLYRISSVLFFVGFTYVFLLDQTNYLNHFYLISLISFLMALLPAHRAFSIDALMRPSIRSDTTPAWSVWILRLQLAIAYMYGGIAKIHPDWLRGEPMRQWLAARSDFPLIGSLFVEEWMVYLFVYGGLLIDLLAPPLLMWRRTRPVAFVAVVLFHLLNARLFSIGIFPWFMIAATTIFFAPDWPRRLLRKASPRIMETAPRGYGRGERLLVTLLAVYVLIQLLVPLRHQLYPGRVSWTEEGHNFSWHMKLRDKEAIAEFYVTDPASGRTWEIDSSDYLSKRQVRKMKTRPQLILAFSHHLARVFRNEGYPNVEVRVRAWASLNGRPYQALVDPDIDLAKKRRRVGHAKWIVPLEE